MNRVSKTIKKAIKDKGKAPVLVFLILRTIVLLCMILQLIRGDIHNALLCLLSMVLFLLPSLIEKKLKIDLPNTLEIIIYIFIFASEILGEINNFYGIIPFWDDLLHTLNGFLCAAVGFSLVELLNKSSRKVNLSPIYLCLVAFCFSMTIGVIWEFFEYGADKILYVDMQKDTVISKISSVNIDSKKDNNAIIVDDIDKMVLYNKNGKVLVEVENGYLDIGINDTMKDLLVNFIGALVFCVFGYNYLTLHEKQNKKSIIHHFVPKRIE